MRTLICHVLLADGTGRTPEPGAVLLEDGLIAEVGHPAAGADCEVVDCGGRGMLAPGFIDAHGHSDLSGAASPACFGKISQGFTTEISGNCGLSPFPLTECNRAHLNDLYRQYGIALDWTDLNGYRNLLQRRGVKMKLESLCGHNTLRAAVAGYAQKRLSVGQLAEMGRLLEEMMGQGALGLSSGLLYTPGCFADREELVALLRVVARRDGVYATHLRSEGAQLLEALAETLDAARAAGVRRVQISHFKTAGPSNWSKLDAALELMEQARHDGIQVGCDRYPYVESLTQLSVVAPAPWETWDDTTLSRWLADRRNEAAFRTALTARKRDWSQVRLASTGVSACRRFAGMPFTEIAAVRGDDPEAVVVDLLREDAAGTMAAFRGMSEENLMRILALPECCCGSDESARPVDDSIGLSHPRGFGSVPEFFRRLTAAGMPVGEVIRKLTGLPAARFGLRDRGLLRRGMAADLVWLDPERFRSGADFRNPHRPAEGVLGVWIDGCRVYGGTLDGRRS